MTRHVRFRQTDHDEGPWKISVDGRPICQVRTDDMDVSARSLEPLWEALGIIVTFEDWESS